MGVTRIFTIRDVDGRETIIEAGGITISPHGHLYLYPPAPLGEAADEPIAGFASGRWNSFEGGPQFKED